jgi:F0F1-type ATP synthase membrane subunit b/b'
MDKSSQVEALKKALDLEILIAEKQAELSRLMNETYHPAPNEPIKPLKQEIPAAKYPDVKSEMKYFDYVKSSLDEFTKSNKILAIIITVCFPVVMLVLIIVYLLKKYKDFKVAKEEDVISIKNSSKYKEECKAIDEEVAKKQAIAEAEYQKRLENYNKEMEHYKTVIIPQYEEELRAWTENHNQIIDSVKKILDEARNNLLDHYETTKVLPVQYRKIEIMKYIYDMISTSDYDILQAIEKYDQKVQRELEMARLREQKISNEQQRVANQYAQAEINLLAQQNDMVQEQNEIADKARRQANVASAIGVVQRHNTNKNIKKLK